MVKLFQRLADRMRHIPRMDNEDVAVCGANLKHRDWLKFYPKWTDTKATLLMNRKKLRICKKCIEYGG